MNNKIGINRNKLLFQIIGTVTIFTFFSFVILFKDTSGLERQTLDDVGQMIGILDNENHTQIYEELFYNMIENWNRGPTNSRKISSKPKNFKNSGIDENEQILAYQENISRSQRQLSKQLFLQKNNSNKELYQKQVQYYQQKYHISNYKQQPFCIIVSSYNNVKDNRYLNNILSILNQNYTNYHIVFYDDFSDDGTGDKLRQFVIRSNISQQKIKIIINLQRKTALYNFYEAAKLYCKPFQIMVIVDGDDELVGRQIFKLFNSVYQSRDIWLAYSNFLTSKQLEIGYSLPYTQYILQKNLYRKAPFTISHLRTFYTKLLRLIKQADLKDQNGNWFRAANDVAMYIPMLQMSHNKIAYLPEISYMYNSTTGLNNHRTRYQEQLSNLEKIRKKSCYPEVIQLFNEEQKNRLKQSMK